MSRLIDADLIQYEPMLSAKGNGMYEDVMVAYKSQVDDLPTIEERKTGKWLPDNNNYYEERFICSVCGKSYKVDTCMGKPMWDFCPCGADMRGGNER